MNQVGAISRVTDWHSVEWRNVNQNVRRLQARIVKATQEKRWNKVKALQHLLTHSLSGKLLAVKRVTENSGKRTTGVDKVTWETPEKKIAAVRSLKSRGYKPLPLKRVYIPKSNGKNRPLGIPTMKDRAMQALYLLALDPISETTADSNSYGFRKGRSTADAIEQCFTVLARKGRAEWILEADIKGCFDNINHEWILQNVPLNKTILRKWLKAGYLDKNVFNRTEEGTPQGGIISPVLANLVLDKLETELNNLFPVRRKEQKQFNFVRYADDFIITGRTKELLENEAKPLIEKFLNERGLELSTEKTKVTNIADGFDFLGQNVRKYNGKLRVKPSKKNIHSFIEKVRTIIRTNQTATAGNLIGLLNPVIRGWANYHSHVVSSEVFGAMDNATFKALWQWSKRRHPNKNHFWIKDKYFTTRGGDRWVFFGQVADKDGKPKNLHIFKAASVPIKRHIKVRGEANPYASEWETYFERRIDVQMEANLKGYKRLLALWYEQNGICPVCDDKITKITGWHSHHIIYRVHGGADGNSNRVLLHPNCHNQVHSKGLEVVKPRSKRSVTKA
ncbi:MAG: group II intron reverse transcriptase/maturase [Pyrinomonadaceae bacterium]|nr:group II intron reverse transcriptase/maturase [Pyrinomonadaceae bacterium]